MSEGGKSPVVLHGLANERLCLIEARATITRTIVVARVRGGLDPTNQFVWTLTQSTTMQFHHPPGRQLTCEVWRVCTTRGRT